MNRPMIESYSKAIQFEYQEMVAGGDTALYCLSPATILLAYNLVKFYGGWRSRYVVETAAEPMQGLLDNEWYEINDIYQVALFELKEQIVTSGDFLTGMLAMADAIRETACCDGPGGTGSGGAGSEPGAGTTAVDDGVNPPTGFDGDYSAYEVYKCDVANWIFDEIQDSMDDLETFNWASFGALSVSAAVSAFLIISGIAIPATLLFVAFGALLAYTGSVASLISAMQASMVADRDDFICSMVQATNVANAMADFKTQATTSFTGSPPDPFTEYVAGLVIDMYITPDLFNRLFDEDTSQVYPTGTCNCFDCELYYAVTGVIQSETPTQVVVEAEDNGTGTTGRVELWFNTDGSSAPNRSICDSNVTFESISIDVGVAGVILYDDVGNIIGNFHTDPANMNLPVQTAGVRHIDVAFNSGQGIGSDCTINITQ